jgi:NTP pyrophosphatase (non-canonical NTP hydrolase)
MGNNWQATLTKVATDFRDDRDWKKFHIGKDLAINLTVEAGELLEQFLWKNRSEVNEAAITSELSDVFYSLLLIADEFGVDIEQAFVSKMQENILKYPVDKFKGSNKKYNV